MKEMPWRPLTMESIGQKMFILSQLQQFLEWERECCILACDFFLIETPGI